MESLRIVWDLLLLLSLFVFTQLLGVLLCFRLARLPRWLARSFSVVGATLAFFWLAPIFFFAGLREAQLRGEVTCGLPAMAAVFMLLIGTGCQLLLAAAIHFWWSRSVRAVI